MADIQMGPVERLGASLRELRALVSEGCRHPTLAVGMDSHELCEVMEGIYLDADEERRHCCYRQLLDAAFETHAPFLPDMMLDFARNPEGHMEVIESVFITMASYHTDLSDLGMLSVMEDIIRYLVSVWTEEYAFQTGQPYQNWIDRFGGVVKTCEVRDTTLDGLSTWYDTWVGKSTAEDILKSLQSLPNSPVHSAHFIDICLHSVIEIGWRPSIYESDTVTSAVSSREQMRDLWRNCQTLVSSVAPKQYIDNIAKYVLK